MLKVRVKMINGDEYVVLSPKSVKEFDDLIMYSSTTDFIEADNKTRLQVTKIVSHQPIGETNE